jgi:hypothetical protein
MGFFGRLRKLVLRSYKNGVYDLAEASKSIVKDAKSTVKGADISGFFTPRYLREVNGIPSIGDARLVDFVQYTREGDFARSFGRAFRDNPALQNTAVRNTIAGLLNESKRTLPDIHLRRNAESIDAASTLTGLNLKSLKSAGDLESAVKANSVLSKNTDSLLRRVSVTKTLKFLGYTVLITGGAITAADIYRRMEKLAAKNTGCFAYWLNNQKEVRKCKVVSYSCKTGSGGEGDCINGFLPTSIIENKDCLEGDNKSLNCIHCQHDDPKNVDLPDNVTLRCEERTAGEMLVEAISETVGNVWTGATSGLSRIFMYGAIFLVVIIVLVIVINFLR